MSRSIRTFWLANLVLFLAAPSGLPAQDLPNGSTLRLTSRLVYVDVVVRERSGQVLRDLTQQDFKVEEDGKPQKVDFFQAHSLKQAGLPAGRQTPTPAAPQLFYSNIANRDAASGAINIILFDLLNTPRSDLIYARKQLLKFLSKLPPGQSVALFVLRNNLQMVQNFTGSSDRLLAAAQSINPVT